jgi:RND family efflux transporter MFP subunit
LKQERDTLLTKLRYTKLVAPFDGLITARNVDSGNLSVPGRVLMVVEDQSTMKIAFDAPQEDVGFLSEGLPVRIDYDGRKLDISISHIFPALDRARMVRVELETPVDAGFRIGSSVPLSVISHSSEGAVTVPRESLMQQSGGEWVVFVVVDGKLQMRPVKRMMEGDGHVQVSGVEPGEMVVISTYLGWANLSDGLKVEVN